GWDGSRFFSSLVATEDSRRDFVKTLTSFSAKYGFDGVDIDWEYPGSQGIGCNAISKKDSSNFLLFLQLLRQELGSKAVITAAVGTNGIIGSNGKTLKDLRPFAKVLNYINLMTVSEAVRNGNWDDTTGPNSPLYTCGASSSVSEAVSNWVGAGFPASQILVGTPSYGKSFYTQSSKLKTTKLSHNRKTLLFQPSAGGTSAPMGDSADVYSIDKDVCGNPGTGWSGQWTYKNLIASGLLCKEGTKGLIGFTRYWDSCTSTPFLFNPGLRLFITYEDKQSATAK
ncbi:glycoside hydrolase, partial [Meredithblackwellia eburnea MCA 4105]